MLLLRKQRIFIPENIRSQFQEALELLNRAVVEKKLSFQNPSIPRREWGGSIQRFATDSDKVMDELAVAVGRRLLRSDPDT
jgi:hypothetical protein